MRVALPYSGIAVCLSITAWLLLALRTSFPERGGGALRRGQHLLAAFPRDIFACCPFLL